MRPVRVTRVAFLAVSRRIPRATFWRATTSPRWRSSAPKLLVGAEPIIGAWTAASLPQAAVFNPVATFEKPEVGGGAFTQISRLSAPLVNELVIGYDNKDRFNSSEPIDDGQSPRSSRTPYYRPSSTPSFATR